MLGYYIVYGFKYANDMTLNPKDTKDTVNGSINANICKLFFFFQIICSVILKSLQFSYLFEVLQRRKNCATDVFRILSNTYDGAFLQYS